MNVFAIAFQDKDDFTKSMDSINVTDTILGEEHCIVFFSEEGFLYAIIRVIEDRII